MYRLICAILLAASMAASAVEAPTPPDHEFSFVVLGDSQFHLPNKFNQVIDEVVHLFPAFVIQVGDLISGRVETEDIFRAQWERFKAQIAPLEKGGIPFMPVPGNHDLHDSEGQLGGERVYREVWGDTYYSWDYRNAHFVVLNTDHRGVNEITGEQLGWLERDLASARDVEHIFVFFHRPIYRLQNEKQLHELFIEHGVSAVIFGHMHHYNFNERDGIPYVMTVSAARMGTPFPMAAGSFHHMLLVTVRGNNFRIAVIQAGSIYPNDIVKFEDNQGLYLLRERFFSEKEAAFDTLEKLEDSYRVTLHVNNPSEQELTTFFEWQLPNERWAVGPLKGRRIQLPAGAEDLPVTFTLQRRFPHPPEAYPSCIARALYLTSDGDVVQSEHTFTIIARKAPP